jgi:hypothetical protein
VEEERGDLPLPEEPVGGVEMVGSEPVEDGVLRDGTLVEVELRFA